MYWGENASNVLNILILLILFSHVNLLHFPNALPVHKHSGNTKFFNEECPLMMASNTWAGQSGHFVFRASFHSPKQPNSKTTMLSSVTSQLDVITATGDLEVARTKVLSLEVVLAIFLFQFLENNSSIWLHMETMAKEKKAFI